MPPVAGSSVGSGIIPAGAPGVVVAITTAHKGSDGEGRHAQDHRQHRRKQPNYFLILHDRGPPYRRQDLPSLPPSFRRAG